jgi:hypothetical protein
LTIFSGSRAACILCFLVFYARLLFLSFQQRKERNKESAAHGPNAPQGHGMATRWLVVVCKALLSGMVLAFCLCGAMVGHGCKGRGLLLSWGNIAVMDGKKKAPSGHGRGNDYGAIFCFVE